MTDPIDLLIDTPDGQRTITIDPVNITPTSGIQYATGQYDLKEGDVGIGTLTFETNDIWDFDGITDIISEQDVDRIAELIKTQEPNPAGLIDGHATGLSVQTDTTEASEETLNFLVSDSGQDVDVRVVVNYPFYDVSLGGQPVAQLEQDHHSNWFVTKGEMPDHLVQAIGDRIVREITGY